MFSEEGKYYPEFTTMRVGDVTPELGSYIDIDRRLRVVSVHTKTPNTYAVCMTPHNNKCVRCICLDICGAPILSDK
jgi:hypothetical protein